MAVATYVGSFTVNTGAGTQNVDVTTYGAGAALPDLSAAAAGTWAIKFWWNMPGVTGVGTWTNHLEAGVGFTTGASNSYCSTVVAVNGVTTTNTGRATLAKAVNFVYTSGGSVISADFSSMLAGGGFRLAFAGPGSLAIQPVNFMLITGLTGAKAVNWTTPTAAGNKAVTGVGFRPDLVFHATTGQTTLAAGNTAVFCYGAMNKHGQQWLSAIASDNGVTTSNATRWQQTDACVGYVANSETVWQQGHFSSMDADGFTMYYSGVDGAAEQMISLCLGGISSKLGAFTGSGTTQTVPSRHGFTPRGAFFSSISTGVANAGAASSFALWSLGGTDTTNHRLIGVADRDGVTTTNAQSVWYNTMSLAAPNGAATPGVEALGSMSAVSTMDFTVSWSSVVSDEFLYMLIGDSGVSTTPAKINLPSTTVQSNTPNQKTTVTLSDGTIWTIWNESSTGRSSYSKDGGITWTYVSGQDIAGWANGSLASLVIGTTEYLAVVWKQTGTGGGRTSGLLYGMLGTLDGGRTTPTWGTAVSITVAGNVNYPDIVAHAQGAGGAVHVVGSGLATNTDVRYFTSSITAGVLGTFSTVLVIGGAYSAATIDSHPSIDINTSTKDLYVAWSAGKTGSGFGIRFKKATYSANTWTWGSEVEVDNTVYAYTTGGVPGAPICRWDGTQVVIASPALYSGSAFYAKIWDSTNFTSFTNRLSAASTSGVDRMYYGSMAINPSTGDVYLFGTHGAAINYLVGKKWTRSSGALNSLVQYDSAFSADPGLYVYAWYANNKIQWVYTAGNNAPYSVKYDSIQLYNPQAGLTMPTSGSSAPLNASGGTFTWSYYAPDGATQTGWAFKRIRPSDGYVEYWNNGSTSWQTTEIYNSGTATSVTFASSKWPAGQSYQWTVSVQNINGVSGYPTAFTVTDSAVVTGVNTYVGSFTKATTAGLQDITITPNMTTAASGTWAIMFWTTGSNSASGTWSTWYMTSLGFTTGASNSYAFGVLSKDAQTTSSAARRLAAKAITIANPTGPTVYHEADFVGFPSSTTMRINWTTTDTNNEVINYMIITGLTGAKVMNWATPAATGNSSVTGVGFSPDLVMHGHADAVSPLPYTGSGVIAGFGAMNKHGQQWANDWADVDAVNPANTSRWQQTDACIVSSTGSESTRYQAHFASMDSDGFTTNWSSTLGVAFSMFSLCLKGVSSKLGAFTRNTSTGSQTVLTRHGFTPKALLMTSYGAAPLASPTPHALWELGVTDGTTTRSAALVDVDAISPTNADSVWSSTNLFGRGTVAAGAVSYAYAGTFTSWSTVNFIINQTTTDSNAGEHLYMLIGDAGTNTTPERIAKPVSEYVGSVPTLTAYSNQRHMITLSNGTLVMVFNEDVNGVGGNGCYGYFFIKPVGGSWTYTNYINGWTNGSISSYVDAGGTERLVASWKQDGAGDSRTDSASYLMVGTFNTARTAITWGTAKLAGGGDSRYNYADLVVVKEGIGGVVHWVANLIAVGANTVNDYYRYNLDSSGNFTASGNNYDGYSQLELITSNTNPTWPSIDIDPATKNLYTIWSNGVSGGGIRFRLLTYASGSWTVGSQLNVDTGVYVVNYSSWHRIRWNTFSGNAVIAGYYYTGTTGSMRSYDISAAGSLSTSRTHTTSFAATQDLMGMGSMELDQGTGDIYFFGVDNSNAPVNSFLRYRKWTRATNTFDSAVTITDAAMGVATDAGAGVVYPSLTYNSYSNRLEWVYTTGNNAPYAVKYDYLQLNQAPTFTVTSPSDNTSVNLNTTSQQFTWTTTQIGPTPNYVFRRRKPGSTTYEYWTGAVWSTTLTEVSYSLNIFNTITITGNTWAGSQSWLWSVGGRNSGAPFGYSAERTITNSAFTPTVATYVGSFTKQLATGNQDITIPVDLTSAPAGSWAIMFWTAGSTAASGTWDTTSIRSTVGFVANGGGTISQYSMGTYQSDAVATSNTARRMAVAAITWPDADGAVANVQANFVSFPTATTMRLNWTAQIEGITQTINYMIITGLTGAKVLLNNIPASTGVASTSGVGFTPDLVFLANCAATAASGVPGSAPNASFGFGMFNKHGQQAANGFVSIDAANPSDTQRFQQTDASFAVPKLDLTISGEAQFVSMDSDGYTLNWSTNGSAVQGTAIISLCLKGVSSKIGAYLVGSGTSQTVDARHGFTVRGAVLTALGTGAQSSPGAHTTWAFGATDGTNHRAVGLADQNGVTPTNAKSAWYSGSTMVTETSFSPARTTTTISGTTTSNFSLTHSDTAAANTEHLYLLLGDPNTNTTAVTVGTSATATATGTTNQKKATILSTGRKVVAYADSTTNAKLKWSDDGVTWTDYGADIAGWSNGSISSYIDSGGTERIVAAWRQSGTGGSRTDTYNYVMSGVLDSTKTAITWGTALAHWPYLPGNGLDGDLPDVVAHAEGNGGKIHIAFSNKNSTTYSYMRYSRINVSATGTLSIEADALTPMTGDLGSGTFTGGQHTFPSIDINPVTKDIYISCSATSTGTGKGIRFIKATYYSSAWTFGSEVAVDTTHYAGADAGGWGGLFTRWSPASSSVVVALTARDNTVMVYESTNFTSFSTLVSSAANDQYCNSFVVDQNTGDIYIIGQPYISSTYRGLGYKKWTRSGASLGSQVMLDYFVFGTDVVYVYAWNTASVGKLEWVYTHGNNSPYTVKYDYLTVNASPVVSLVSPEAGARSDLSGSVNFSWSFTDAESNTQSKYIFRRRRDGYLAPNYDYWTGSAWTTTYTEVTSSTTNVTFPSGSFTSGKIYYWSVGVKDSAGSIGYSSERKVTNTAATVRTYVGSFTTATVTGNQDVTIPVDLTTAPSGSWAVLFFSSGNINTSGTWMSHPRGMVGFTAGAANSYSVSIGSADGQTSSLEARRMAAKAITFSDYTAVVVSEADFVSFPTASTMRINWTTNGAIGFNVNYTIITGLSGAKVVNWGTAASVGDKVVTGVGFQPDLVLNAAAIANTALPQSNTSASLSLGAMNKYGQQWANSIWASNAANPANSSRWQQTDAGLLVAAASEGTYEQAHFKSMDSDGFTMYFSDTGGIASQQVISLAIKGVSSKLGAFAKDASASQVVSTRHGFTIRGAVLSEMSSASTAAPTTDARWSLGATDMTNHRMVAFTNNDAVSPTVAKSVWRSDSFIAGLSGGTPSLTHIATAISGSTSDMTLSWTTNDGSTYEQLYLLLGDAGTDDTPSTIGTSTSSVATAYSNQKKLVRLSTGRMVAVYANTTTNAKFKYSDDGITWTDYSADIASWSSGSIASYTDTGGTERIVAVYNKGSEGTSSARTYLRVGTLNTARTALSWGSENLVGGANANSYPDVVALKEGSGGVAWVVLSYGGGTADSGAYAYRYDIDSSGTAVANGSAQTLGQHNQNPATWPSIDYNPTTKDLYTAWSAGATGSGKGIRFKKATYLSGSWTWGTEREIDTARYMNTADWFVVCRYDGTRVVIGAVVYNGSTSDMYIYERDPDDTATVTRAVVTGFSGSGTVYGQAFRGSIGVNTTTGDIYFFGVNGAATELAYYVWTRSTATLGSRVVLEQVSGSGQYPYARFYSTQIEWVYTAGNNSPYAVKYDYITSTDESTDNKINRWGIIPI